MSFRARLAIAFALAMTVLVAATSAATYLIVRSDLHAQARDRALALARAAAGESADEPALNRVAGPGDRVWLTNAAGRVVASSSGTPRERTLAAVEATLASAPGGAVAARAPRPEGGFALVLLAGGETGSTLSSLLSTLLAVGAALVAVSALMGAVLADRALRPVERMRRQVDAIPGDALDARVSAGGPRELARLARSFNRLLERAGAAADQQQRFVADASHELRTPVTALQGHARIVARAVEAGDPALARESAGVVLAEAQRLGATIGELLALSESAAGPLPATPVRLDRVAAEACEELRAAHPGRRIEMRLDEVTVPGDPGRLAELVRVLVDNAVKYSPADGSVEVAVEGVATPRLDVRDHGPGLSEAERARVFDRFFRGAAARGTRGSGLGLAIARAIADRHGAGLELADAEGGGTIARVTFRRG